MSPPSSGSKNKPSMKPAQLDTCFQAGFFLGLFFDPENGGDMFFLLTFNGLHGAISQKIELFITAAVGTSNSTI
jgi:hypothetical protein